MSAGPRGVYDPGCVDDPVDRQVRMARAAMEALNSLGFFLCSSATRTPGADELDRALQHAANHLPFLLQAIPWRAGLEARPDLARRMLAGLEGDRRTITGVAERGLDRDSPAEARAFRQAIRNILVAAGVPLPAQAEGPCELHGATCPVPEEG